MNKEDFYIFTPGPVRMPKYVLEEGSKQIPYFRTTSFSKIMLDCESMLLDLLNAKKGTRVLFLAASGTGAMEAVVTNLLSGDDNSFIVNGGSFGQRFVDICKLHGLKYIDHKLDYGSSFKVTSLFDNKTKISSVIVNGNETSTGVLYDLNGIGQFCKSNGSLFIVDAISMFLTDPLDMDEMGIDAVILSSQKGLALPPGLSMIVLSEKAQKRVLANSKNAKSLYLKLDDYLKDMDRGQTPFTPPVGIINQLHVRLKNIINDGGINKQIENAKKISSYFRSQIQELPLRIFSESPPNAITALTPTDGRSAQKIVTELFDRYGIYVCPNGGELKDTVLRVAHMGDMDKEYVSVLVSALKDYYSR